MRLTQSCAGSVLNEKADRGFCSGTGRLLERAAGAVHVEVKVPVAVPCKTADVARPAFAVDQLPIGATIDVQMRALRAERHQRIGYERELIAANEACKN